MDASSHQHSGRFSAWRGPGAALDACSLHRATLWARPPTSKHSKTSNEHKLSDNCFCPLSVANMGIFNQISINDLLETLLESRVLSLDHPESGKVFLPVVDTYRVSCRQVLLFRNYFYNTLTFLSCQIQGKSARFLNFLLIHGPGCVAPPGGGNAC